MQVVNILDSCLVRSSTAIWRTSRAPPGCCKRSRSPWTISAFSGEGGALSRVRESASGRSRGRSRASLTLALCRVKAKCPSCSWQCCHSAEN